MKKSRFVFWILVLFILMSISAFAKMPKIIIKAQDGRYIKNDYSLILSKSKLDFSKNQFPYIKSDNSLFVTYIDRNYRDAFNDFEPKSDDFVLKGKYPTPDEINELEHIIKDYPLIAQLPNYPTGCEAVAAVSLLNFFDEDVTVDYFLDNCLDNDTTFYYKDGKRYGPSPYKYFIGNPRTTNAWGCMSPVIEDAMADVVGVDNVINLSGNSLSSLCKNYVSKGIPVVIWVSIHMMDITYNSSWYLEDGSEYFWPTNEHCMVLIGYDTHYYYLYDPYVPAIERYKKETVENKYNEMDNQALTLKEVKNNSLIY